MRIYTDLSNFKGGDYVHFHETDDYSAAITRLPFNRYGWGNENGRKCHFVSSGIMNEGSNWNYYEKLMFDYDKNDELIVSLATEEEIELFELSKE